MPALPVCVLHAACDAARDRLSCGVSRARATSQAGKNGGRGKFECIKFLAERKSIDSYAGSETERSFRRLCSSVFTVSFVWTSPAPFKRRTRRRTNELGACDVCEGEGYARTSSPNALLLELVASMTSERSVVRCGSSLLSIRSTETPLLSLVVDPKSNHYHYHTPPTLLSNVSWGQDHGGRRESSTGEGGTFMGGRTLVGGCVQWTMKGGLLIGVYICSFRIVLTIICPFHAVSSQI